LRWMEHIARMKDVNSYKMIVGKVGKVGKAEEKRPRRRWEDNVKVDLE